MPEAITKRISVAMMFGLLGPAIGALLFVILFTVALAIGGGEAGTLIGVSAFALAIGYIIGLGPAFTAGIFYALTPPSWPRLTLAPLYGAAAVWLFYFVLQAQEFSGNIIMLAAGAVAALACAAIVRKLGLDA